MKFLLSLIIAFLTFSNQCLSQSSSSASSSSSSSSSCPEHYSGENCEILNHYSNFYYAAPPEPDTIEFVGIFGDTHNNLEVTIGGHNCVIRNVNYFRVSCFLDYSLNLYQLYDVEITQNNITWFKEDYYGPLIEDCGNGHFYMGACQCYLGWTGQDCNIEALPFISTITPVSIDGGIITLTGWFGSYPTEYSFEIGLNKVKIHFTQSDKIIGYVTQGPNGVAGNQDIKIYNSNNVLVYTGVNQFLYDSNLCFNNCFNMGICNNGVCECFHPWVGDFCSHTIDTNLCQCSN
ncbi:hypothetical protein ACTFIZ_004559 [Dictyostelium cf. discoideum]